VFGYLKLHPKRKLAFNAQHPMISERMFKKHDWNDFYRGVKEAIPGNMPKPRGNTMTMHCFVNASHGSTQFSGSVTQNTFCPPTVFAYTE
jgi:hypothetical protein